MNAPDHKADAPCVRHACKRREVEMRAEIEKLRQRCGAAERRATWLLHNGGLLNEWAVEWATARKPSRMTCIAYLEQRVSAAIGDS